jgi:hypothetical protein
MSRHGYTDDCDGSDLDLYRGAVDSALRGRRGQAFLREMIAALDAMPDKALITGALRDEQGGVCAMGAVCVARGLDTTTIDYEAPESVSAALGIAPSMAAEIAYKNDECYDESDDPEDAKKRWQRMRAWAESQLVEVES